KGGHSPRAGAPPAAAGGGTVPADRHSLASRIAAPHALANDAGRIRVGEWLGERADCEAMLAVRGILATHPPVRTLIEAMASSSVHLWDLMRTDAARAVRLLETDPDGSLAARRAVAKGK